MNNKENLRERLIGYKRGGLFIAPRKDRDEQGKRLHYFERYNSYGISEDALDILKQLNIRLIHFQCQEGSFIRVYAVLMAEVDKIGIRIHENYFEPQIQFPVDKMHLVETRGVKI